MAVFTNSSREKALVNAPSLVAADPASLIALPLASSGNVVEVPVEFIITSGPYAGVGAAVDTDSSKTVIWTIINDGITGTDAVSEPFIDSARVKHSVSTKVLWQSPGAAGAPSGGSAPVVGMTSTPAGKGYWLVGSEGGVFSFGDASLYGSTGNPPPELRAGLASWRVVQPVERLFWQDVMGHRPLLYPAYRGGLVKFEIEAKECLGTSRCQVVCDTRLPCFAASDPSIASLSNEH